LRAGAIAAAASILPSDRLTDRASAIGPIDRQLPPHFRFSLAAYSYRDLLSGDSPSLTLFDFANDCAKFGLEATELTSYYFPKSVTHEYIHELKRHCFRLGLDISGTAVGNDFGHPDGPARAEQITQVKRWIEYAEMLGAPVIRIFAGHVHEGMNPEEAHRLMVSAMQECCEFAGQHGIQLALENHGGPTATATGLLSLVKSVDSPWFGVNLDTGNFHSNAIYDELEEVAPYSINVQIKASISGPGGKKQPADYARLAKMLRDVNYRGYVVLEYEDPGDPRQMCPIHLEKLREAFHA
jgi:sugar phosphate isomerase/epimerase